MFRIHPRTLLTAALLPTALLMAADGVRQPGCRYRERHERHTRRAFAGQLLHHAAQPVAGRGPGRSPNQDHHLVPGRGRSVRHAGGPKRQRPAGGVTASFSPSAAAIGGRSVLTLTAAPSSAAGAFAATVTAMTLSSDPIGTSAPLGLTISAP
jgi:hypothetical protein